MLCFSHRIESTRVSLEQRSRLHQREPFRKVSSGEEKTDGLDDLLDQL